MAQTQWRLLPRKRRGTGSGLTGGQKRNLFGLAAFLQRRVKLVLQIEMIFDHALVAPGDEHEMFNPGFQRLVHHMLDQRAIDHGEHFLRHRLGGGQETCAETGDGKDGFADFHEALCG